MGDLLAECIWPGLEEPYRQGLRDAVAFIVEHFEVLGIVASGTIIRGNPNPNSDFDIYVVHAKQERQMIQKFFNGVPTQIFVNPPSMIRQYFEDESRRGRPSTAHMLATGFVMLERDPVVERLREEAGTALAQGAQATADQLTLQRYSAADRFENVLDVAETDPATANMLLGVAVYEMLQYTFLKEGLFIPRDKDLLRQVAEQDARLGQVSADFYRAATLAERLPLGKQIADLTIETHGFFEWETQRGAV